MDSPEKKHEKLPIDLNKSGEEVNMEIVNQYGQLMGDFSKLDDELWLAPPAHDESLGFCSEGLEWKIVSSHPQERTTEQVINNSVNDEGIVSMENNSSSNDSSQNCSSSVSPVSILRGRSVKTRKIADLLQLNPTEKNPPAKLVKKCVHCDSAKTPQWRNGPMGRKTLCNACGLQYKKGLLSDYHRPLQTIKPQTEVTKKCVHCESASTPQWRDGPLGLKTLCNACGIQYKKRLLSPDYRPIRNPRRNTSPPLEPAKNSSCDPYQKKDEEIMLSEKTEIDRNYTSDADDSSSDTDFKPTTRKKRQPVVVDKKCAHCETTTTPQWREGPLGRKTLCNACGVQYRNGRLFPEYRPLQSPSYDPSVHSHLPKKVEQMRMQKLRMMERAIFGTDI